MGEIDYKPIIKRMIILSWAFLGVCFLFKLFGANIFECYTDNKAFRTFCRITETFLPLKYLVCVVSSCVTLYLLWLSMLREKWFKQKWQLILSAVSIFACVFLKICFPSTNIFCDIYLMIVVPVFILYKQKGKLLNIFIVNSSYVLFSLISLFVKEVSLVGTMTNDTYTALLSSIDVWIMELLLYFYLSWWKEG